MPIHRYDPRDDLMPVDMDAALARARDLLANTRANPDAERFTLEQCEAHLTRLEALHTAQERGPNAAITGLLASPAAVLADRDRWPRADDLADGADLLADAYRAWIVGRAMEAGEPWREAAHWVRVHGAARQNDPYTRALAWLLRRPTLPFPVGKACPEVRDGFPAAAARDLLPFDDDVHAALLLPILVGDLGVTVFFPAHREPYEVLIDGEWLPGPDRCVIDGTDPRTHPVRPRGFSDTRRHATIWWKSMAGLRIVPGERNRERKRSPRQMIDALIAYKSENRDGPPSRDEFLENVGIEPTQWQRLKDDWGIDWKELRQSVYGTARRERRYIDRG
jgi:hypothetical protein